jgi:hypothetical protein
MFLRRVFLIVKLALKNTVMICEKVHLSHEMVYSVYFPYWKLIKLDLHGVLNNNNDNNVLQIPAKYTSNGEGKKVRIFELL